MPPVDADLRHAAETLRKIVVFVEARRDWSVDGAAAAAMSALAEAQQRCATAAERLCGGIAGETTPPAAAPPCGSLPAASLDAARLQRFAGWLGDLGAWLESRESAEIGSEGAEHLSGLAADLTRLGELAGRRTAAAEPPSGKTAGPPPPPPPPRREEVVEAVDVPAGPPLVLINAVEAPLLREVAGQFELAERTRQRLELFLRSHGVDSGGHNLRRLELKLARWIEATPDGQALVLKVGGLHGRREPYPSYISRDRAEELEAAIGPAAN